MNSQAFNLRLSQAFNATAPERLEQLRVVFSICHRILVWLQLEQFRVVAAPALVAVPLIFIKVETPAVGTVQYFDQSQTFSAASVAVPDNVEAPAVSVVETVVYTDLWQISSAVTAPAAVTVPTATTTVPFLDLSLLLPRYRLALPTRGTIHYLWNNSGYSEL